MMQYKAYGQAIIKTHLKITKVVDGDGIFVMNIFNKQEEEIRFLGIDAPEIKRSKKLQQDERETHLPVSESNATIEPSKTLVPYFFEMPGCVTSIKKQQ
ncbi:MAG: hypothetical protein IPP11_11490 [Chitinophagaceae bacterium]|nr:hypothetical protein [Chitinophagaceae bacterium]